MTARLPLEELTQSTLAALTHAGLGDIRRALTRRVLARPWPNDTLLMELLLYEVRDVARSGALDGGRKRMRITWAMTMVGR